MPGRSLAASSPALRTRDGLGAPPLPPPSGGVDAAALVREALSDARDKGRRPEHFFPLGEGPGAGLAGLGESFAEPARSLTSGASRSGALLFLSGDGRFFAKTTRESEYQELWALAVEAGAGDTSYQSMLCTSSSFGMSRCRQSLLVPIVLAFTASRPDGEPLRFLVMPAAFHAQERFFRALPHAEPGRLGGMLDVKPLRSRSEAGDLAGLLKKLGLRWRDFDGFAALRRRLAEDASQLHRARLIDYSMLVWNGWYLGDKKLELGGDMRSCIQRCDPAAGGRVSCTVFCFKIIDYLMRFTFYRHVENKAKYLVGRGDKFLDYGGKMSDMMQCFEDLPLFGLEYMECGPYLHAACTGQTAPAGSDEVCATVSEHMALFRGLGGDIYVDVSKAAAGFVDGCFHAGFVVGAAVTFPAWFPVYVVKSFFGWLQRSVISSVVGWAYSAVRRRFFRSQWEEEERQRVLREERLFLQAQAEAMLDSENDKASFQHWCQQRLWRSFHDSQCITTKGLRWNHARRRWEATWKVHADRLVFGFDVGFPTETSFAADGTLDGTFDDFEGALQKAAECLQVRDVELCAEAGGTLYPQPSHR